MGVDITDFYSTIEFSSVLGSLLVFFNGGCPLYFVVSWVLTRVTLLPSLFEFRMMIPFEFQKNPFVKFSEQCHQESKLWTIIGNDINYRCSAPPTWHMHVGLHGNGWSKMCKQCVEQMLLKICCLLHAHPLSCFPCWMLTDHPLSILPLTVQKKNSELALLSIHFFHTAVIFKVLEGAF